VKPVLGRVASSLINMILGSDKASASNGALGETFKSTAYQVRIDKRTYNVHDTAGFGEHNSGTVNSAKAVINLSMPGDPNI